MAKKISYVLGAILVLVGLVGFFNDPVIGIFEVDTVHNLVHLVTGIVLIVLGVLGGSNMMMGLKILGVIYAIVAVLGFIMPGDTILGIIESNLADDVLHLVLAVILLYAGFMMKEGGSKMSEMPPQTPPQNQGGMGGNA